MSASSLEPSRLRSFEMLMGLVAIATFAVIAGFWMPLVGLLAVAVLASWWVDWRYSSTPSQQRLLFTVIGLPFLAMGLYTLAEQTTSSAARVSGFSRIAIIGVVYVLCGAVVELYRAHGQARPAVFHAGAATAMLVAGITYQNPYYPYCVALYALGLVGLLRRPSSGMNGRRLTPSRAPRWVVVVCFLLAAGVALRLNALMPRVGNFFYRSYAASLADQLRPAFSLFGSTSDLSTVADLSGSNELAARVFGPATYLRGQVMVTYQNASWEGVTARADRDLLRPEAGGLFQLPGPEPDGLKRWRIQPIKVVAGPLPVPAGVYSLRANLDELELDPFDGLVADNQFPYQVTALGSPGPARSRRAPQPGTLAWQQAYLQLPEALGLDLRVEADRILEGRDQPEAMAERLEHYLASRGIYDPGAEHPRNRDPIVDFLRGDLAGHCEYFATSMALMLRAKGVPCRYVIGYLAMEKNPVGGYLVVRDRDSHAWVEAYVDGQWRVFDPTPAAEHEATHPDGLSTPLLAALWDGIKVLGSRFWLWISSWNWERVGGTAAAFTLGLLTLLTGFLGWRFRKRLADWWRGGQAEDELAVLWGEALRLLAGRGLERKRAETPRELAARAAEFEMQPWTDWLLDYNRLRFRGAERAEIEQLRQALARLREWGTPSRPGSAG